MSVGAISPVSSGSAAVYAALSPYLNGTANVTAAPPVTSTAPAAPVAAVATTAASTPAPATTTVANPAPAAAPVVDTTPPYLNPAIPLIAAAASLWPAGASIYGLPVQPAVTPVPPVSAYPRVARIGLNP
ncbi:MAG TPA: hypothetical protein VGP41_12755 [Candidatus Lustribacter sp.]|nr:hypothetical protein [Candidatus Lustribacter sp.]